MSKLFKSSTILSLDGYILLDKNIIKRDYKNFPKAILIGNI